jgi:hypothetical protein
MDWPRGDSKRIANVLTDVDDLTLIAAFRRMPERDTWDDIERHNNRLFYLLCSISPTTAEMLDVLARRAESLASAKYRSKGDVNDTFFTQDLVRRMLSLFQDAGPNQIANVVAPVVSRALGVPAFERCKVAARRIKARG